MKCLIDLFNLTFTLGQKKKNNNKMFPRKRKFNFFREQKNDIPIFFVPNFFKFPFSLQIAEENAGYVHLTWRRWLECCQTDAKRNCTEPDVEIYAFAD